MTNAATQSPAAAAIVATRAVHRAMAQTVASNGQACSKELYTAAAEFNATHFGGLLTAIMVEITAPASPRALATHEPVTPEGVDCVIRIAPSVINSGTKLALDVLLHEMIHVWQAETDNREPGYAGHGPKFAAKCNEIGRVRPAGYYGEEGRAPKAVAHATGAKTTRAPRAPKRPLVELSKVSQALLLLATMTPEERAQVAAALVD
jgi:hypothetical protein